MIIRRTALIGALLGFSALLAGCGAGLPGASESEKSADRSELNAQASDTLSRLAASQPEADQVIRKARGLLIFPEIVKGGLVVGASAGDGVFRSNGKTQGYYRSTAVSYGLQAGVTKFGYVVAFMDQASIDYLDQSDGWEIGVGPVVTVADEGFASRFSSTTLNEGIVVFFVGQEGFFAGTGIEGTKVTRL
ncbi:MAG: twin-arginine translocation pathway signal protein [Pseudomonadota bacterium]